MTPDVLARLHAQCFRLPPPWSAADFAQMLSDPACVMLHRADAEALHAFVLFRLAADEAELLTLATAPAARRKGFARALVCDGLAAVARRGARQCFLEVAATNIAARGLYQTLGFAQVGQRKAYYRGAEGVADALVLKAKLST